MSEEVLEIKERVLKILFKGVSYSVRFPNVEEAKVYLENLEKEASTDALRKFLDVLGLPMSVSALMEFPDLDKIAEKIQTKKNF